jgi:hypothetical protein
MAIIARRAAGRVGAARRRRAAGGVIARRRQGAGMEAVVRIRRPADGMVAGVLRRVARRTAMLLPVGASIEALAGVITATDVAVNADST